MMAIKIECKSFRDACGTTRSIVASHAVTLQLNYFILFLKIDVFDQIYGILHSQIWIRRLISLNKQGFERREELLMARSSYFKTIRFCGKAKCRVEKFTAYLDSSFSVWSWWSNYYRLLKSCWEALLDHYWRLTLFNADAISRCDNHQLKSSSHKGNIESSRLKLVG